MYQGPAGPFLEDHLVLQLGTNWSFRWASASPSLVEQLVLQLGTSSGLGIVLEVEIWQRCQLL